MSVITSRPQWPLGMMLQPPLVAGRFYSAPQWFAATATQTRQNSWLCPFCQPRGISWATVAVEVTTAVSAGSVARLAYYESLDERGIGRLVRDFGTVATDSTGAKSITVNEYVPPGLWWILVMTNGSGGAFRGLLGSANFCQNGFGSFLDSSPDNNSAFQLTNFDTAWVSNGAPELINFSGLDITTTIRVLIGT